LVIDAAPHLTTRRAQILCLLGKYPKKLADLRVDLGGRSGQLRRDIAAARADGWPIWGNQWSGYTLEFDGTGPHARMREALERAGERLYGVAVL